MVPEILEYLPDPDYQEILAHPQYPEVQVDPGVLRDLPNPLVQLYPVVLVFRQVLGYQGNHSVLVDPQVLKTL